tara:strand:- start:3859 stop:4629 length:771 start_codon:yes stop_codon:yes gene_type:complete
MSSNTITATSKNDIIERRTKRKREETQNNVSKINFMVKVIHNIFNSYEHEQEKDFFDFYWDRYSGFGSKSINEQFILDNLIEIIDELETKFSGCKIRYIPCLKLASGKYYFEKNLEYGIGFGTKINNSNWMRDIRSVIRIDWSESNVPNHHNLGGLAFNTGFNPTVERKPVPAAGGFGAGPVSAAGGKPSPQINFCRPAKRVRTSNNLEDEAVITAKRQDMREKVLQKKREREIAKLTFSEEEVKAMDWIRKQKKN